MVCFFLCLEVQTNISSCGPGHGRTGQLKFRSVFDFEPRLQLFKVFSRELLVLQALKAHLSPPALFTRVSSVCRWIKLNLVLQSCAAAAWVASCSTAWSTWLFASRDKRGPPRDELQRGGGDQVSVIKTQLPLSFLPLASISISPPPDPPQSLAALPPRPPLPLPCSACVLSFDPL